MKLILENWKKYLKEARDARGIPVPNRKFALVESEEQSLGSLEKKYLGIDSDTITQIGNDLVDMRHRPFALIKLHMADKYGINLNKPQSGAFRTTYQITDDIVIKIAHETRHGLTMNGDDYLLATEGGIGSIFPKYYGSPGDCEKGCSWIAMEKVTPMTNLMGERTVSEFFPSTLIKTPTSYNEESVYTATIAACINRTSLYGWLEEELLKMINQNREDKFDSVPYDKLYYDFKYNSKNFQSLSNLVKKYPEASPNELLAHPNCGIGSDGRFVVLDSSFFG